MSYSLCNHVLQLVQLRLTVCGNGWQAVLAVYGNGVQPCLTVCAIASYSLCNYVLRFMETVLEVVRAKISGYIKS
jgi:hypothetical protein